MILKIALLTSLLLHSTLFLNIPEDKKKKPKPKPKITKKTKIRLKFSNMTMAGSKPCPKFYTGIGISYNTLFMDISEIAPGGPAYYADIRVGDILLTDERYKGLKIGTPVEVVLLRNGITIIKKFKIGKVCQHGE